MTEPSRTPLTFDFAFDSAHRAASLPFGVTPDTCRVELDDSELRVRFGPWSLRTPVANIVGVQLSGPYSFVKTAGPARLSFADRGLTCATTGKAGVCLEFADPIRGIDPLGLIRHPGLTLTVADPQAFATAVTARLEQPAH